MQTKVMLCPSCGAPTTIIDGSTKSICSYCGLETFFESQLVENLGDKVTSSFRDVGSGTQFEIKRLQVSQELSILQMQLGNLRTEKRNLERDTNPKSYTQLRQVIEEEKTILARIATLQNPISPPLMNQSSTSTPLKFDQSTTKSWGTTLFLAITLGMYGGHRYYTGRIGSALIQTFTIGGFYIWWLIDIISIISGNFTDSKGRPLDKSKKANKVLIFIILGLSAIVIISGLVTSSQ